MNNDNLQPKFFVTASSLMISVSSYIFSVSIGLPYIFMLTSFILICSILIPYRVKYSDRSVIYSVVIALTLAVIFDLLFPMDRDKFMLVGELLFINITAPFLLYFCSLLTFFRFNIHMPGLISAICISIILLTADIQKGGDIASKLSLFHFSPRTLEKLFVKSILLQIPMILWVISYGKPRFSSQIKNHPVILKSFVISLGLILTAGLIFFASKSFNLLERRLRSLEGLLINYGTRTIRDRTSYYSSRTIDLRQPMRNIYSERQQEIILRASSSTPPGYLRGRAFDHYHSGSWLPARTESNLLNSKTHEGILAYRTFFFGEKDSVLTQKTDFLYSPSFKTDILLLPGNFRQIETVAERIKWNNNGVFTPEEWEKDSGYTVYYDQHDGYSAFNLNQTLQNENLEEHLAVPEELYEILDEIIDNIFPDNEEIQLLTDAEIAEKIKHYFLSNYSYSLDFQMSYNDTDPLQTFFRTKKGHCELFATSSALIARRLGIPSRYITGFLCFEPHPSGKYYISRLENAHAWCEIFLRDEGKWILLESTPEDGIPRYSSYSGKWNFLQKYSDYFYKILQTALANVRRGFFAKAVIQIVIFIYEVLRDLIWHPIRGPLMLTAALLFYLLKKMISRRIEKGRWKIHENTLQLVEIFAKFEKRLTKISRCQRLQYETAHEWIKKIFESNRFQEETIKLFLNEYSRCRYNPQPPSKQDISRIKHIARNIDWTKIKENLKTKKP